MSTMLVIPPLFISIVLLLIRIVVGISFFFAALNKAKHPRKSAKQNGIPLPLLYFIMAAEFAGAAGVLTGVLGQFAALGLMLLMTATLFLHVFVWKSKYWAGQDGWEYDLMLFSMCAVLFVFGMGAISL